MIMGLMNFKEEFSNQVLNMVAIVILLAFIVFAVCMPWKHCEGYLFRWVIGCFLLFLFCATFLRFSNMEGNQTESNKARTSNLCNLKHHN